MINQPEPAFQEPWHAQVFAITVHLNETGHFSWPDWANRFGATLKRHGLSKELNGGDDYFLAWVETLENFLSDRGTTTPQSLAIAKDDWERAYLSTPHGAPVKICR